MANKRSTEKNSDQDTLPPTRPANWQRSTLFLAAIGALIYWAALPPLKLWPLAWLAPVAWVQLIRVAELPGRRPYCSLYLIGTLFWFATLHWLRFPHWATSFGWVAMSLYLGIYLPLFIGLSRVAVHRLRVPVIFSAPIVWAGLELLRAHAVTGFTMGAIEHTQLPIPWLLQIADLTGQYGVAFVMMMTSTGIACLLPVDVKHKKKDSGIVSGPVCGSVRPLMLALVILACTLFYGWARTTGTPTTVELVEAVTEARTGAVNSQSNISSTPRARVALIQGSIDLKLPPESGVEERTMQQYGELTLQAARDYRDIDLIVWPETVWPGVYVELGPDVPVSPLVADSPEDYMRQNHGQFEEYARYLRSDLLLGVGAVVEADGQTAYYNSALMVRRDGTIVGRYDKMHRVLFGEYVPFADQLPFLAPLESVCMTTDRGFMPQCFQTGRTEKLPETDQADQLRFAPNICYETVIPHLIRKHVVELRRQGNEPDVLINLTNDGWFRGSNELDLHLACGVLRAIECRKPMLIAANTGFSAAIDSSGRIIAHGPRRDTGVIVVDVQPDGRTSLYTIIGDWPAGLCLLACVVLVVFGIRGRMLEKA